MRPIIFLLTFLALNCASLLPKDQREVTRIHDIKGTKKDLYDKSLEFFAKNMGNSLQAIQIKDAEREMCVQVQNLAAQLLFLSVQVCDFEGILS